METLYRSLHQRIDFLKERKLMTSQRPRNFAWESTQDKAIPTLNFKGKSACDLSLTSISLTSLLNHRSDRSAVIGHLITADQVTGTDPMPISGLKIYRKGGKDQ
ncbi:hypothetical protein TNCV_4002321 [Trichonephila clavipes]|uniref:Uncharacterized protein n=1 Tax=Trichonephila clavipes TaxID=2585209 RepID=A0A8X6V8L3_TRICX|nr:hypothetical protein TNCV_4002321 [Trichonephila clavipes]